MIELLMSVDLSKIAVLVAGIVCTLKALLDCEEQLDFIEGVHISTILA